MTYYEEKLALAVKQLELMLIGFDCIVKDMVDEHDEGFANRLSPYNEAIEDIKSMVEYYTKEVQKERDKE